MKRILIFLLFFPAILFSNAQLSEPFPTSSGAWKTRHVQNECCPYAIQINYFRKYVNGDTTINSTLYHKLYFGSYNVNDTSYWDNEYAFYRVDGYKVYFRNAFLNNYYYSGFNDTVEHLLYDYTMNIGDSILHCNDGINQYYLILMDYYLITINGEDRYRFDFVSTKPWFPVDIYWIDGIGSNIGFFNFFDYFEGGDLLYCFYNGVAEYPILSGDCSMTGVQEFEVNSNFSIYPNPANSVFHISFLSQKFGLISIYNMEGKLICTENCNGQNLTISQKLVAGFYNVVFSSETEYFTSKLVITD